ncbi:2'-5' RNA ligase family protein [Sphingomonas echinoides]|uniref:2'-5' RNA ligase family protein n=1 Tax=Sphingomonas echinoides TaxID=59803 RepID=UPI002413179C|nr:2'-5' RNA ligase family protein [Sphingomonas echinoides]
MTVDAPPGAPIIVTALFGPADTAFFDDLRRTHFPPERNQLAAHLTMFHHLAPSLERELKQRLTAETRGVPAPVARISGLLSLGRGVAFRIACPELEEIRASLAEAFETVLTPQDRAGWRPHVTIQNKVEPAVAKTLKTTLEADFRPRDVRIVGLASWWYRGGPWEPLSRHIFA